MVTSDPGVLTAPRSSALDPLDTVRQDPLPSPGRLCRVALSAVTRSLLPETLQTLFSFFPSVSPPSPLLFSSYFCSYFSP